MKFVFLVILLSVATLAHSLALAFDCRSALVTFDDYSLKYNAIKKELSNLSDKKKLAESDYNRVDSDLRDTLAQLDKDIAKKQEEFARSIDERQIIGQEYKKTSDELTMGLYCSKCQRSKSEIEREEREPFYKHLENVKGRSKSAPAAVLRKAYEDYRRKRERSYQKTVAIEKDIERLDEKITSSRRAAERRKADLLALQSRTDYEIKEIAYRENPFGLEFDRLKGNMRANNCGQ